MTLDIDAMTFDAIRRDQVDLNTNGFVMVPRGRGGTIYFVENGHVVPIGIEMPGVSDLDVLVYGETKHIAMRYDPIRRTAEQLSYEERKRVQQLLLDWLSLNGLRHDVRGNE